MSAIKTILHPTDFSGPCAAALEAASSLARDHQARLLLLHVVPKVIEISEGGNGLALRRGNRDEQDHKSYVEDMRAKLQLLPVPAKNVTVERLFVEGTVVGEILRTALDRSCDLIVMGTHGWTGEGRQALGSIAEVVSLHAPCSVVMVKVPLAVSEVGRERIPEKAGAAR